MQSELLRVMMMFHMITMWMWPQCCALLHSDGKNAVHVMCLSGNSTTGSPMLTQCGQILVPSACAAFIVVDFINKHAGEARKIRQEFERSISTYYYYFASCGLSEYCISSVVSLE